MALVTAPNADTNETVVGVVFTDGVGETSDTWALEYFRRHGYTIDDPDLADLPDDLATEVTKDPVDMTKVELQAYAAENSIDISEASTKAGILALVIEALAELEG